MKTIERQKLEEMALRAVEILVDDLERWDEGETEKLVKDVLEVWGVE